jgi:hypothetical protein
MRLPHSIESRKTHEALGFFGVDGELDEFGFGGRPVQVGELPGEVIECGTEVVHSLADDQGKNWRGRLDVDEDLMPSALRIQAGDDFVRVGIEIPREFSVVGLQVCLNAPVSAGEENPQ